MALQSSGAIKFSELQTEYGGTSGQPITISGYYRSNANGMFVVDSVFSFTSGGYNTGPTSLSTSSYHYNYNTFGQSSWIIGGTNVGRPGSPSSATILYVPNSTTSPSADDIKYVRGSVFNSGYVAATKYQSAYNWYQYSVSRYLYVAASSTTVYYNANVPTSGTIAIRNFHGGNNP